MPAAARITALFASGQEGAVLPDLSDYTKLFKDQAGTLPVTAPGDAVGKAVDGSGKGHDFLFTNVTLAQDAGGKHCLRFGSTSTCSTSAIDLSTTDKATLWAAYRKEETVTSILAEFGPQSVNTVGTFGMFLNNASPQETVTIRGPSSFEFSNYAAGTAPQMNYVAATYDMGGATAPLRKSLRVNGVDAAPIAPTGTAGAGNFTSQALNMGGRAGGTLPFVGFIYALILRGGAYTAAEVASGEVVVSGRVPSVPTTNYAIASIGDSVLAAYLSQQAVCSFLDNVTRTIVATPGHTIAQQKTAWQALTAPARAAFNVVFIQVGLNDVNFSELAPPAVARLQDLVTTVRADVSASCKIYIATMTPAKARWIGLDGASNGAIDQQKWADMNAAIAGGGPTPITGVDARITAHTTLLGDGSGNLAAVYETAGTVDGIHPNNLGRAINARVYRDTLMANGFF